MSTFPLPQRVQGLVLRRHGGRVPAARTRISPSRTVAFHP